MVRARVISTGAPLWVSLLGEAHETDTVLVDVAAIRVGVKIRVRLGLWLRFGIGLG